MLQYILASNDHIVHLKLTQLYFNKAGGKRGKEKKKTLPGEVTLANDQVLSKEEKKNLYRPKRFRTRKQGATQSPE